MELATNPKHAKDLAERALLFRRRASVDDAALYVAAAEAAGDPGADALLCSMRLSFRDRCPALDSRLRYWRTHHQGSGAEEVLPVIAWT